MVSGKFKGANLFPQAAEVFPRFIDVLDAKPAFTVIAVHVPLGLPSVPTPGGRACDTAARRPLGFARGAAVVPVPTRAALEVTSYDTARQANGGRLSTVTWSVMPWVREVAAEMQPYWQRTVFEVHPELGFHRLNDDTPLTSSKRTPEGMKERRQVLEEKVPGIDRVLDVVPAGARPWHVLDAAADLWTARLIMARAVTRLPEDPVWDDTGLRMEIVY